MVLDLRCPTTFFCNVLKLSSIECPNNMAFVCRDMCSRTVPELLELSFAGQVADLSFQRGVREELNWGPF